MLQNFLIKLTIFCLLDHLITYINHNKQDIHALRILKISYIILLNIICNSCSKQFSPVSTGCHLVVMLLFMEISFSCRTFLVTQTVCTVDKISYSSNGCINNGVRALVVYATFTQSLLLHVQSIAQTSSRYFLLFDVITVRKQLCKVTGTIKTSISKVNNTSAESQKVSKPIISIFYITH